MKAMELVRLALSRLGSSRLRAALTMLGVIIGVASVVSLVAVGQGATSGVTKQLQGLGTNLLTVNPGATTTGFTRGAAGSANTLTIADAQAIGALAGVAAVEPEVSTSQFVVAGTQNTTTTIMGTTGGYTQVRNFDVWQGATLNGAAVDATPAGCRSGCHDRRRPGPDRQLDREHDQDRRPAVQGRRDPAGQGQHRSDQPGRPDPRAVHDGPGSVRAR